MGGPAGEGDDSFLRSHDARGAGREIQGLPVLGLHEPYPGSYRVRPLVHPVQATSPRSTHVQVLLRLALQHPEQLVPVRGPQIHQLPHSSPGQGLQSHSCHAHG